MSIYVKFNMLQQVSVDKKTPVNVELRNVTVEKALRTVLEDVGTVNPLGYVVDEGVVTISTKDDLATRTCTRVYSVQDIVAAIRAEYAYRPPRRGGTGLFGDDDAAGELIDAVRQQVDPALWGGGTFGDRPGSDAPPADQTLVYDARDMIPGVPTFRGTRTGPSAGGRSSNGSSTSLFSDEDDQDEVVEVADQVLDLIRTAIAPDTWAGGPAAGTSGSIRYMAGMLIVTQTLANHRLLADLLTQIREHIDPASPLPRPLTSEALFTHDGRITGWVAEMLERAGKGRLSRFSSVRVAQAGGRTFARIGGVWLETSLAAADRIRGVRGQTPAAEALLRGRAKLAECFRLGAFVAVRAGEGVAVTLAPYGIAKAEDEELAAVIRALGG